MGREHPNPAPPPDLEDWRALSHPISSSSISRKSPARPVDATWESRLVELGAGDSLLVCTDGILEARSPDEMFGAARLHALLDDTECVGEELLGALLAAVRDFAWGRPVDDDLTLMTWRVV